MVKKQSMESWLADSIYPFHYLEGDNKKSRSLGHPDALPLVSPRIPKSAILKKLSLFLQQPKGQSPEDCTTQKKIVKLLNIALDWLNICLITLSRSEDQENTFGQAFF